MTSPATPVAGTTDPLLAARVHIGQFVYNTLDWNLTGDLTWPTHLPQPRVEVEFAGFDNLRLVTTVGYGSGPGDIITAETTTPNAEPQLWWGYTDEDNNGEPRPAHLAPEDAELVELYARTTHRNAERIATEAVRVLIARLDLLAPLAERATKPFDYPGELETGLRRCACSWTLPPEDACLGCGLSREESDAILAGRYVPVYVVDSTRGGSRDESRFFSAEEVARAYAASLAVDRNRGDVQQGFVPVPKWVPAEERTAWCRNHPSVRSWLLTLQPLPM